MSCQAFLVDIYARPGSLPEGVEPTHIGMCYVYPDNLRQTCGSLNYPITNMKFQPIGKITSKTET